MAAGRLMNEKYVICLLACAQLRLYPPQFQKYKCDETHKNIYLFTIFK